jgi:hypothetical protein
MSYENRMYMILHPTSALVASQNSPEQFAKHYTTGPTRHYQGKVVFAEIDIDFRNPFFQIDEAVANLVPHEDGRPKATKFISSYRVLEHMDLQSIKSLYLTSPEGQCLELKSAGRDVKNGNEKSLRIYAEVNPLRMLVLSQYNFEEFGRFITDPRNPVGAPAFLYTELELDTGEFLQEYEDNPFVLPPIPGLHPSILRDAIGELANVSYKSNKGLSLDSNFDRISYKLVKSGFMFASRQDAIFFPMPPLPEIERTNYKFFKAL